MRVAPPLPARPRRRLRGSAAWIVVCGLSAAAPARALTEPSSGPYLEIAAGGALGTSPVSVGPALEAGVGAWFGSYDEAYSIGRYTALGLGLRAEHLDGAFDGALVAEVRRGFDVIVLGPHLFVAGGPRLDEGAIGGLVEAGVGLKGRFRFTGPYSGLLLRLHGGVAMGEQIDGRVTLTLGLQASKPFRKKP